MINTVPRIYFDSCCFIDMVRTRVGFTHKDRDEDIWYYNNLLDASRSGDIQIFTSYLTVNECLYIRDESDQRILDDEVKRLFNSMILSGKSGVMPVLPTKLIMDEARDLHWTKGVILKPYDSLHVASALDMECSEFITTDFSTIDKNDNMALLKSMGLRVIYARETKFLPARYRAQTLFNENDDSVS